MRQRKKPDFISVERNNVWKYFIGRRSRVAIFFVLIFVLLLILFLKVSIDTENIPKEVLSFFLPILVAIIAIIFAIPRIRSIKEYQYRIDKRKVILTYLCWFIAAAVFYLLLLGRVVPLTELMFKVSISVFVVSFILLISYVLVFIHSSINSVLINLFNVSALPFVRGKNITRKSLEGVETNISTMGQLIIRSIDENDYRTFSMGLKKLGVLGMLIMEASGVEIASVDHLFKTIIKNHRYIVTDSEKAKVEGYIRKIFYNMASLIKFGMSCSKGGASALNYSIAVIEMKKIGIICVDCEMHSVTTDLIGFLGQIGDASINLESDKNLIHPPDIEVLISLQEIGIKSANRKLEALCMETLIKIHSIADLAKERIKSLEDPAEKKDGEKERKGIGKVFKNALKSHWVVSAFMFKNIPESEEWLGRRRIALKEEFGDEYLDAYERAYKEMRGYSSVGKKVLMGYKDWQTKGIITQLRGKLRKYFD